MQRVTSASVRVDGEVVGQVGCGLVALLAAGSGDSDVDVEYTIDKILGLRIFADDRGQMNRALAEVSGGLLLVSQFTLYGDCRKGRRPSFVDAMEPVVAERLYNQCVERARASNVPVATGRFAADMKVELINDGPVTLLIDSKRAF